MKKYIKIIVATIVFCLLVSGIIVKNTLERNEFIEKYSASMKNNFKRSNDYDVLLDGKSLKLIRDNWDSYSELHNGYHWAMSYLWAASGSCERPLELKELNTDGFQDYLFFGPEKDKYNVSGLKCLLQHSVVSSNRDAVRYLLKKMLGGVTRYDQQEIDTLIGLLKTSGISEGDLKILRSYHKDYAKECRDGKPEQVKEKLAAQEKELDELKVYFVSGFIVAQHSKHPPVYEIVRGSGERALLETNKTEFTTRGEFSLPVRIEGMEKVEVKDGFSQKWPRLVEDHSAMDKRNKLLESIEDYKVQIRRCRNVKKIEDVKRESGFVVNKIEEAIEKGYR